MKEKAPALAIDTALTLPYDILDIEGASDEHFVFRLIRFSDGQTAYSVRNSGIQAEFGIVYHSRGMDCAFACDITTECVRDFMIALENSYDGMGSDTVILQDLSGRTAVNIVFDHHGHIAVDGKIYNKDDMYSSIIIFAFDADVGCVLDAIAAGDKLFAELYRLRQEYAMHE